MGFVRLGNTTAHDFVKEEIVQKLKKDGYLVEKEDFHAGGLGKSGGVRLFCKEFTNGKNRENTYRFPSAMESVVESWKLSDRTLLKELKCFDSKFKHYIANLKKNLKESGRFKECETEQSKTTNQPQIQNIANELEENYEESAVSNYEEEIEELEK